MSMWKSYLAISGRARGGSVESVKGPNKRAESDRDKLVSVAENSTDFIAMYDENFVPVYLNQAGQLLSQLMGVALAAACGAALLSGWATAAPAWVWWCAWG